MSVATRITFLLLPHLHKDVISIILCYFQSIDLVAPASGRQLQWPLKTKRHEKTCHKMAVDSLQQQMFLINANMNAIFIFHATNGNFLHKISTWPWVNYPKDIYVQSQYLVVTSYSNDILVMTRNFTEVTSINQDDMAAIGEVGFGDTYTFFAAHNQLTAINFCQDFKEATLPTVRFELSTCKPLLKSPTLEYDKHYKYHITPCVMEDENKVFFPLCEPAMTPSFPCVRTLSIDTMAVTASQTIESAHHSVVHMASYGSQLILLASTNYDYFLVTCERSGETTKVFPLAQRRVNYPPARIAVMETHKGEVALLVHMKYTDEIHVFE